jgi:hypothetical protein
MLNINSAQPREETPHTSDALKRCAQSVINNKSIDVGTRFVIVTDWKQTTRGSEIWCAESMPARRLSTT